MSQHWSGFSYIVINLARFVRPNEVTFSGVNSTLPMLACLLAKRAYDFDFVYINVAGGVDPKPSKIPISSSDPVLAEGSTSIFANEDFYDLCTRGRMDLCFLGRCANRRFWSDECLLHRRLAYSKGEIAWWRRGGGDASDGQTRVHLAYRALKANPRGATRLCHCGRRSGRGSDALLRFSRSKMAGLRWKSWHPEATLKDIKERTGFIFDAERAQADSLSDRARDRRLALFGSRRAVRTRRGRVDLARRADPIMSDARGIMIHKLQDACAARRGGSNSNHRFDAVP